MLSLFVVLSPRGDTIISKDYRGDSPAGAAESFFRKVKFWGSNTDSQNLSCAEDCYASAPPVLQLDGMTYVWVKKNGLMFACNTRFNASASLIVELLNRMIKVFKDYCGVLSEEAIRKNFILIYELLDEVVDFGYAQGTSTESLKAFVYNEPVLVDSQRIVGTRVVQSLATKTTPSSAIQKPISGYSAQSSPAALAAAAAGGKSERNEIFVDIIERLTMLFSPNGSLINSTIDGCIQMKSYLAGNPELRLALNEDLVVGKGGAYGSVILDDCNFHECVRLDDFETHRLLSFFPPEGEFIVLNYRCTGDFRAPFRVLPSVEELSSFQLEVVVIVRADIPDTNYGANFTITVPVPRTAAGATPTALNAAGGGAGGHTADYDAREKKLIWTIKKFQGGTEHAFRAKIALSSMCTAQTRKEIGPVSLSFEIPMYNVSNLQVKYLRIAEQHKGYNPYRWVRYVTRSSSYVCRC
mmetsp:Transcript_13003/g.17410  ORF Transcript_13003/g.17410 Transcript_13003/m.17410 type:complete len:468 (+) Transcript_13003:30-1433(+)